MIYINTPWLVFVNLFENICRDINKNVYDQLQSLMKCNNSTLLQFCYPKHNKNNLSSVVRQLRKQMELNAKQYTFTEFW